MLASTAVEPIALRIVVDGASSAGKTSTARSLAERLGRPVTTPQEDGTGRTVWFDWLDHVGGRSDGRPLRTQVVTVPGHLPDRRRRLLATADAVLFVADTSHIGMPGAVRALDELRDLIAGLPAPRPGIVVQANKRDLPGPSIDAVRRRLGLAPADELVETRALDGDGVRQAFVFAVRLALRHRSAEPGDRAADAVHGPDDLLAELDLVPLPAPPPPPPPLIEP